MKILQVIQKKQLRGAEIFACQLSQHLVALGHQVLVLCLEGGEADMPFRGEIRSLAVDLKKRFWDVGGWKKFSREVAEFQPDLVQANAGDTLKYAVLSKLIFRWRAPIVFRNASTISSYIKSPWVLHVNRFLFSCVKYVVSVSEYTRKDFVTLFPEMKNRTIVIPIGIELAEHGATATGAGYLLHVGGFTFEKNHEALLRIMNRVARLDSTLELLLVGDGPLRQQVEKHVKKLGLQNKVRFLGYQKEVMPYMKSARVLLLPSIIEGLPGVILEAMYCRTPVVAYNVGGISEVVKQGETGWLVNAGDEEGFVAAILEVMQNTNLDTIKENAYTLMVNEFDNRVIANRFLAIYARIIKVA